MKLAVRSSSWRATTAAGPMLVQLLLASAPVAISAAGVGGLRGRTLLASSRLGIRGPAGATSGSLLQHGAGTRQQPEDFFSGDMEQMDELPNHNHTKQCHPKCTWDCGAPCGSKCSPRCEPPKCFTSCKKPVMAKCHRRCMDPQCAVVCPAQCEHGSCPKCKTVCNKPVCVLDCGQGACESSCQDPICAWDCAADPSCKPSCKLHCDSTVCEFGNTQKLPDEEEAPYLGMDIAWKGLGKIPMLHYEYLRAYHPAGALPYQAAGVLGGPSEILNSVAEFPSGETGITATPDVLGDPTHWAVDQPPPHYANAPPPPQVQQQEKAPCGKEQQPGQIVGAAAAAGSPCSEQRVQQGAQQQTPVQHPLPVAPTEPERVPQPGVLPVPAGWHVVAPAV